MPLSPPVEREPFHRRRYEFGGYRRADGLWDIEGRMTDVKSYSFPNDYRGTIQAGEPLHDMSIRLTIDEDFLVHDIEVVTDSGPFGVCAAATANFKQMIGMTVGLGWRRAIRERVGGVHGCTHQVEMLQAMATVAFQTLYPVRAKKQKERPADQPPPLLNTCHAFRSDGEIVKKSWPAFYTGD